MTPTNMAAIEKEPLFDRPRLGDEVTQHLRDRLMKGEFRTGQRMGIDAIARELHVSTMPVREALYALAGEGLLEVLPRRGFRVARIGLNDMRDAYEVSAFISGALAERAAEWPDRRFLPELDRIQADIERLFRSAEGNPSAVEAVKSLNIKFHSTINHVSDSDRLRWFLAAASRFNPRSEYDGIAGWLEATVSEHGAIIEALKERDGAKARELVSNHIAHAGRLVVGELERRGYWSSRRPSREVQRRRH
jgi:DNA-binding GntR family transcriptional regulator